MCNTKLLAAIGHVAVEIKFSFMEKLPTNPKLDVNVQCLYRLKKKDEEYSIRVVVGALWLWLLGICASVDLFRVSSGTNLLCNKNPTMSCVNRMKESFEF